MNRFLKNLNSWILSSLFVKFLKGKKFFLVKEISLWDFLRIYINGIIKGALGLRAAAISWSLFFSVFPFLLVIFGLLPFVPHYKHFEKMIFDEAIPRIFPIEVADYISYYLKIILTRDFSLFNVTTLLATFFATRGFVALFEGFYNTGVDLLKTMSLVRTYFVAFLSLVQSFLLISIVLLGSYYSNFGLELTHSSLAFFWNSGIYQTVMIFVFFMLYLLFMMFLYYYGAQAKVKRGLKHIFPGAFLTTVLFFLSSWLFRYYVSWFNNFEILYGSIGLLLVVMLWLNVNVIVILIGFELNTAITYAEFGIKRKEEEEDNLFGFQDDED